MMVGRVVLLIALVASMAAHADAAAVLPLMAPDLLEPQKRAIVARIRAIAAENGVTLQPAAETAKGMEQAKKAGAACNIESLACQAQMGVLLGTTQVVVARVASDWAGDRLELRLLDALRGATLREATHVLPKDAELRTRVVDGVILSVLAPTKTGSITIVAGEGVLLLDGVAIAPAAAKVPIEGLAPGPHDVELRVEGQAAQKASVVVKSGATISVAVGPAPVVPTKAPPVAPPQETSMGIWLVGGGAALATAAGIGAGSLQAALEYSAMERDTRSALQVTGISLLGATAVGVVVAGAGGVMMLGEEGQ